jgi:SARP family transcriptional regulator, regulator of embCAB operon
VSIVRPKADAARVQLCGTFAVELSGRRVDGLLPGRQGRLLFAYLALSRHQRVSRDGLVDALWGENPPGSAATALNALVSKVRAAVGSDLVRGRTELQMVLPEPAHIDVEAAVEAVHVAETAVAVRDWRGAWSPSLAAHFVARRPLLPDTDAPWARSWRRRLANVDARALECYATACLQIGGTELPGAERAARALLEIAPLRETAHLLLMRTLAARGNVAEALTAYQNLRILLREELGVSPCQAVQDVHAQLLA